MSDERHDDSAEDAPTVDARGAAGRLNRIGRYTVRRVIASGGMGTVLEAIQDEPRRPVAIKIMKGGVGTPDALHRFQFEAQLLARLRHPAIAQIYEAGTHDDGSGPLPFFAMEYIPNAKPITEYVKEKRCGLRERLELFAQVCDAVHHGHQKGIIHRDIKPGNVLVDSGGAPHIIDFGVARAADSDTAQPDYQTEVGQLVGSIAYMSPEQFDADPHDLDMRSDVYSLGLVLYEMLTGSLPYDIKAARLHDAARIVRDVEPRKLRSEMPHAPDEVETIVSMALAKDRDQRYQSAHGLAEDLRRFLRGDPIAAAPPSATYQFRTFARRQKPLLVGVGTLFVVLVSAAGIAWSLYLSAEQQRAQAERESARAQSAIEFLTESLASLEGHDFDQEPTVEGLMDEMSAKIDGAFPEDPDVESDLRRAIAWGYMHKLNWSAMQEQLHKAIDLRKTAGEDTTMKLLTLHDDFQLVCGIKGDNDLMLESRRELVRINERRFGPDDPQTLAAAARVADALALMSHLAEAQSIAKDTYDRRVRVLGADHEETVGSEAQLAWLQLARGDAPGAEAKNRQLFDTCRANWGDGHSLTRLARSQLSASLIAQHKLDEAASVYGNRKMPDDLSILHTYQGVPDLRASRTELLVFWETWCPYSQRTVPSLEDLHLRYSGINVIGLTRTRTPSSDDAVMGFIESKHLTFPVAKVSTAPVRYFDVRGTPWIIIGHDGLVIWENYMDAPEPMLETILQGLDGPLRS